MHHASTNVPNKREISKIEGGTGQGYSRPSSLIVFLEPLVTVVRQEETIS